ncbi:hypothetical protein THAOC_22227 [Thalassiosira oceanica]|uniref:Uncharacterized protein n=1 Tax=Thalassiosira oceanica TaxID=159749 RepID=K0SGS5_THAOC|nr:hypothetical protein THAOC_22227 [Thalassiosira oceanica]|eukprot:EJK57697.1 hypothetical protein THAOC_22227 [Thalassiosira oceanica]
MSDASEDDISLFFGLLSLVIARSIPNFLINESECAFAKETLLDGHEDFEYFSASQGDERSDRLKACVESSDWRALKDELSQLSSLSADDRGFYFQVVASAVQEGWPATRTEDLASFSPMLDDWWELFYERLVAAASELMAARSLCISDPLVYSAAVHIKIGLGEENSKDLVPFKVHDGLNTHSNEPVSCMSALPPLNYIQKTSLHRLILPSLFQLLYSARISTLRFFCEKWHGSHQQMFQYAREITHQLSDGHPLWVLIPLAHVERVMIEKVANYWKRTSVQNEIINSFRSAFPGEAGTTVQAKSAAEKSREWFSRNYFAFCLAATGHVQEARSQIRIIGKRPISSWPWCGLQRYKAFIETFGFDADHQGVNDDRIECNPTRPVDEEMGVINPGDPSVRVASAVAMDDDANDDSVPLITAFVSRRRIQRPRLQ